MPKISKYLSLLKDALFLGTKFRKFQITFGAGGNKRYHLDLNETNLSIFKNFMKNIDEKAKNKSY